MRYWIFAILLLPAVWAVADDEPHSGDCEPAGRLEAGERPVDENYVRELQTNINELNFINAGAPDELPAQQTGEFNRPRSTGTFNSMPR